MIVLIASIGYISFGYFIKKKFKGREVMAFCLLIIVSLPFDLIVLGFRYTESNSTVADVFTFIGGFFTFMQWFVTSYIFSMEIGKVELLSRNKKIFGMVICSSFFLQYTFFVMIYEPITHFMHFKT